MTKENKTLFFIIALSTLFIATTLAMIVYFIFGERASFFFTIVFAIPLGAIFSLLLMMVYNKIKPNNR